MKTVLISIYLKPKFVKTAQVLSFLITYPFQLFQDLKLCSSKGVTVDANHRQ